MHDQTAKARNFKLNRRIQVIVHALYLEMEDVADELVELSGGVCCLRPPLLEPEGDPGADADPEMASPGPPDVFPPTSSFSVVGLRFPSLEVGLVFPAAAAWSSFLLSPPSSCSSWCCSDSCCGFTESPEEENQMDI